MMERIRLGLAVVAATTLLLAVSASADAANPRGRRAALNGLENASFQTGGSGGVDRLTEQISLLKEGGSDVPGVQPPAGEPEP
jgi:hypothetical protein